MLLLDIKRTISSLISRFRSSLYFIAKRITYIFNTLIGVLDSKRPERNSKSLEITDNFSKRYLISAIIVSRAL